MESSVFPLRRVLSPINCPIRESCVGAIKYAKRKFRANCALEDDSRKDSVAALSRLLL